MNVDGSRVRIPAQGVGNLAHFFLKKNEVLVKNSTVDYIFYYTITNNETAYGRQLGQGMPQ